MACLTKGKAMRTALEIKENITALRDELDAIVAVTEREQRDLNEDESARVADITEVKIPHLSKQLKTAISVEKEMWNRASKRLNEEIDLQQAAAGTLELEAGSTRRTPSAIKIPAKAKVHGNLRAFTGPEAEKDAYIAGNVILAGIYGNQRAQQFCRDHGLQVQNTMSTNDNGAGGFIVPEEMQRTIIRLREERGVFPQFANRMPMGSDIVRVPRLLSDVTAYWVGEKAEITPSDAELGSAELMARKLGALTKVSTELDEDAVVEVGDMITQSMAYAMADKIDEAAFNGDGTSTYGGVLGLKNALHANAVQDALTGNNSALTLDLADFEATVGKYPQYTGASPRWFMHSAVYWASAARLVDAAGGNTTSTLAMGPSQQMFLGYPVTFVQVMPSTTGTLATTIVAYFGDLRLGATYGVRRSVRTEVSRERYFENDLIGIKTTERVAINVHERGETIRTRPIVALKTAS
jgi:HK97 family phage major capsid protein